MNSTIILGAGFLGSALAVEAARKNWNATLIGRSDPFEIEKYQSNFGRIELIRGDAVTTLPEIMDCGVDSVVIAAGGSFPVPSANKPQEDAIGAVSLLIGVCEVVRAINPNARIIFLSSAGSIYMPGDGLRSESDVCKPTSPYGMSRLVSEMYLEYYRRVHGLSTHSLRCVNVYGRLLPRDRGQGVISSAFWSSLTGAPFVLHGDGQQSRDFIHVDDFAAVTLNLLEAVREIPPVINVGTGIAHSVKSVVDAVESATGRTIERRQGPFSHTDTGALAVDTTKLRQLVKFEPIDLHSGINLMSSEVSKENFDKHTRRLECKAIRSNGNSDA